MSLLQRVKMIVRSEMTARNTPENKYGNNYIPFIGKMIIDCIISDSYKDLFLAAFTPSVKLDIGVQITESKLVGYNNDHGFETFLLGVEYNSCILEDVSDAPKDLYKYNNLSNSQIASIEQFVTRQVDFRSISKSEGEGEIHAMIMISSIMLLLDYLIDAVLIDLQHQHSNGVDISEIQLPYPVDFDDATEDDFDFGYFVEMNGIEEYAESIEVPVYPPFSPQMAGVRKAVLDYIHDLNIEWYELFIYAFEKAENDYTNQLG